jgi:hypothetical protein
MTELHRLEENIGAADVELTADEQLLMPWGPTRASYGQNFWQPA